MKKLFALLLAMMMVFALAACDTGDDPNPLGSNTSGNSQNGGENNNGGEENNGGENNNGGESIYDIEGQFSVMQIAFIESLGKSEEGKKFVAFKEKNGYVEFYVAEWNDDATTLKNLTHYTVYFTNASFTASERYQEAMDDYQKKWNMCESLGTDPSTILANYKEKSEELCMTAVDETDSVFGQQIVTIETYEDIARRFYDGATLVE